MNKNLKPINELPPFLKFCYTVGMLPTSYRISMTYEEQVLEAIRFIKEEIIPIVNSNALATKELQEKFIELVNYVDNLDVQDEVNNKLNQMAEDGSLAKIINQEIFTELNNKINKNTNDINTLNNQVQNIQATVTTEISQLKLPKNFFRNKKYLLIGDSYADGYTPDGNVTSWQQFFVNITGLTNTIQKHLGGTGFVNLAQNKNFQSLLEEVADDTNLTDIVVLGGYNDTPYNQNQIYNAINAFIVKANEKFPNADIHIGFVGWSSDSTKIYPLSIICQRYREACGYYMVSYLNNIEFSLHNYFDDFSSDGIHPNSKGQVKIGRNLIQALMTGSCNNPSSFTQVGISYDSNIKGTPFGSNLTCYQNNNLVSVSLSSQRGIAFVTPVTGSGLMEIEIGTINNGYIVGSEYNLTATTVLVIVHDSTGYYPCIGNIVFRNGKVYIQFSDINDAKNNFRSFTDISEIQVGRFSNTFDAFYC